MPDKNQLKCLFPSLITNKLEQKENVEYQWFETENTDVIGINKEEMNQETTDLLSIFLKPVTPEEAMLTDREKQWTQLLRNKKKRQAAEWPSAYRFILFSIEDLGPEKEIIKEAFQSLFPQEVPLLWTSDREGFMVEEIFSDDQEVLEFEGIPEVLMSDFYTKIHFFISEFSSDLDQASSILTWSEHGAEIAKKHKLGSVLTYKDIIPFLYLEALPKEQWEHIRRAVFKEIEDEKELLQTIRVFLESGSNTTLASKKLYMHRNSLQYRVDKFIDKTGINIKQFDGAIVTFLALLHMDY
ncbi:PucR family transcriptional regulator [Halobacillus karajensis]|uniref:Leucine-rich protein n=1 Tax=Halobacillus karajensis TaxID=195088 RepID=A0A059NWA4_9BACI|nr:helix-turn-helix domain-containing protein [Halobacillus karajensis]CDQ21127.1 Leucine-rich protein [Halobacillus karajensis]CDQ24809.1 Leucine-rich protein [Halobacillus karajensis]CDQ28831.1 Leucine-rich protein [Halobacillus karajensis]